jgi:hypothetical protein
MFYVIFITLVIVLSTVFGVLFFQIFMVRRAIKTREQRIISLYKEKIDKIPAFIEIMSKNTAYKDIFIELIHLHKIAIISNIWSVYDILENNGRIHREFLFLMKVSVRLRDMQKNGNFLYIRDFIIFYENTIARELLFLNSDIKKYSDLLQKKDLTIVGLLFPFKKLLGTEI